MNYQKLLEKTLDDIKLQKNIPKLLLHACCGPCSSYVLEYLSNFFNITVYYYNPNIYPEKEYIRRMEEAKKFVKYFPTMNKIEFVEEKYEPKKYYSSISGLEKLGERSERCYKCYEFRMEEAAKYANIHKFDYFTTTLSISPYKNADWINEIGMKLEAKYNIKYLFSDFKKKNGYKRSLELSAKYNLYRQYYCGCIYSKLEREAKE